MTVGTGSEDYFLGSWNFGGRDGAIPFAHHYYGAPIIISPERTGGRYGLQTICEGGGMANGMIIERI